MAGRCALGQQDQGTCILLLLMDFRGPATCHPTAQWRCQGLSPASWCQGKMITVAPCSKAFYLPCLLCQPGQEATFLHLEGLT